MKWIGVSDGFESFRVSYVESWIKEGFITIPFGGFILTIGRKGIVDWEKELPEHFKLPEILGKTSVSTSYSLTFDWIVWLSFTLRSKVFYGFDLIYRY